MASPDAREVRHACNAASVVPQVLDAPMVTQGAVCVPTLREVTVDEARLLVAAASPSPDATGGVLQGTTCAAASSRQT